MVKKYYYKAMDKDMKGRNNFQFKIGETYTIESNSLEVGTNNVFHFCERLEDTIEYYDCPTDRHFLIEVFGELVGDNVQFGATKIQIVKEISREELEKYVKYNSSELSNVFLGLYSKNGKILKDCFNEDVWSNKLSLAKNINTPVEIFKKLLKEKSWVIRLELAKNVNIPIYILKELAKDKVIEVREQAEKRLKEITQ